MIVTSGYRTMEDHLRIYAEKGIADKSRIPMGSKHLVGAAVDIFDPDQKLQDWVWGNQSFLRRIELWCERFTHTPNWVHFQSIPYGSWQEGGSIFFIP